MKKNAHVIKMAVEYAHAERAGDEGADRWAELHNALVSSGVIRESGRDPEWQDERAYAAYKKAGGQF